MAFGKFEGGAALEMSLGGKIEKPKEESSAPENSRFGLNTEQLTRFGWLLNQGSLGSIEGFENRQADIREHPEDYPKYTVEKAGQLLTKLKFLEATSEEFSMAVKELVGMME